MTWLKPGRETAKSRQAFADYVALGPGRTLTGLWRLYKERAAQGESVPTNRANTIDRWASEGSWRKRVMEMARQQEEAAVAAEAELRQRRLEEAYAQKHERLRLLNDWLTRLDGELREPDKLWLPDYRLTRDGERIRVERFNAPGLEQLRGLLDDIAKEMGERTPPTVQMLIGNLKAQNERLANVLSENLSSQPELLNRIVTQLLGATPDGGCGSGGAGAFEPAGEGDVCPA